MAHAKCSSAHGHSVPLVAGAALTPQKCAHGRRSASSAVQHADIAGGGRPNGCGVGPFACIDGSPARCSSTRPHDAAQWHRAAVWLHARARAHSSNAAACATRRARRRRPRLETRSARARASALQYVCCAKISSHLAPDSPPPPLGVVVSFGSIHTTRQVKKNQPTEQHLSLLPFLCSSCGLRRAAPSSIT